MSNNKPLENASDIIDLFGGIRPMAAKIDTPVTTVQGWKKRDVIPAARRDQIIQAAKDNDIDLSAILGGEAPAPKPAAPKEEVKEEVKEVKVTEEAVPAVPPQPTPEYRRKKVTDSDDFFATMEANNRKMLSKSVWIAMGLILLAAFVMFALFRPSYEQKAAAQRAFMEQQTQELIALKEKMNNQGEKSSFLDTVLPTNIQDKMDDLQNQAKNIQNTVDQLSDRAGEISSEFSSTILGDNAGPLSMRLELLEEKMAVLSQTGNFGDVVARIGRLEGSFLGQEQLKGSVQELQDIVSGLSNGGTLHENLADAQSQEGGALSQTLQGVSGNDLKAAAMLIAFSQLRDSLNREAPFESDLTLLEGLVGDDNIELKSALDKLAPHADGGVLTASGLSGEFKALTGDILEASLKGEDISFKERAQARLGNLLQVEKEGELLNGTQTQISVAKAQKLLDAGNIEGAISELQTLEGDAALSAQPFLERAEISLMAEKVQQMLGENILARISGQLPAAAVIDDITTPSLDLNMEDVKRTLQETLPHIGEQEVIRDEESGVIILPSNPSSGFKGFSGGQ